MSERVSYASRKWGKVGALDNPDKEQAAVLDRAIAAVAIASGISPARIVNKDKRPEVCDARFIVYHICMNANVEFSRSSLGRALGRDHGTIINGINIVDERLDPSERAFAEFQMLYKRTMEEYEKLKHEKDPKRMVQELCVHDG